MTDSPAGVPGDVPAAFNGSANGSASPAQQTAQGVTAIAGMLAQMPQQMLQALATVLQQVPVQTRQHLCFHCLFARLGWEASYEREMQAAIGKAAEAAGLAEADPRRAQLDPAPHLPAHLRPGAGSQGMPSLTVAVTTVNGTDVCSAHIPGRQGGKQLLLATGSLSPGMLAGLG